QLRARGLPARRVADHPREIADDENDAMPRALEIPHLPHDDGMPEVDVGRRRVETDLHGERGALRELALQILLVDQIDGAAGERGDVGTGRSHGGRGLYGPGDRRFNEG